MVDNARFEFGAMEQLTNRMRAGHQDMTDLRASQYTRNTAAGEGTYAGAVQRAFLDTGDGMNQNYLSRITPAHQTIDDNWQSTTNFMGSGQDSATSTLAQAINPGS